MRANLSWITDQLATGGDWSYDPEIAHHQFHDVLDAVDLVIDMREEDSDYELWEHTDMDYVHVPADDRDDYHIPYEVFDTIVERARPYMEEDGKIFVHCHMGVHRGPSGALAVLLDQRVPATRAYDLIRQKRPQAAVGYALDAMGAHLARRGVPKSEFKRRMTALDNHIKADQSPDVVRAINRHIKRQQRLDEEALLGGGWPI